MPDDLAWLDALAQADLVRRGEASPRELVEAAIERIERVNPEINAIIIPLFDKARAAADSDLPAGPFRGVPIVVKDLLCHTAGDPHHAGLRMVRDAGWVSPEDTFIVTRLRQAGFVIVGKANTPEIGSTLTTEPLAYGPTRNPWSVGHSVGGSSGGSAAAVAAGMTPVAEANDGAGSIRVPASSCGVVGLKPSRGRISLGPTMGDMWDGFVTEGAVARTVRDTAAMLDVVAGSMPGDPYLAPPPTHPYREDVGRAPGRLRIGLMPEAPGGIVPVHPDCTATVTLAARQLESLGHVVETSHPAAFDDGSTIDHFMIVVTSWIARDLEYWSEQTGRPIDESGVEPANLALAEIGRSHSAQTYIAALQALQTYTRRAAAWWADGYDLLLTPTAAEPPPPIGDFAPTAEEPDRPFTRPVAFAAFTSIFNVTGQPAISLPLGFSNDGLPIGVQLAAAYGREDLLIRVAAQLEAACPWADRRPAVHA